MVKIFPARSEIILVIFSSKYSWIGGKHIDYHWMFVCDKCQDDETITKSTRFAEWNKDTAHPCNIVKKKQLTTLFLSLYYIICTICKTHGNRWLSRQSSLGFITILHTKLTIKLVTHTHCSQWARWAIYTQQCTRASKWIYCIYSFKVITYSSLHDRNAFVRMVLVVS